jgi:hypothetical protein
MRRYMLMAALLIVAAACARPAYAQGMASPNQTRLIARESGFQAWEGVWTVTQVTIGLGGYLVALLSRPNDTVVFRLTWTQAPDYKPGEGGLANRFAEDYRNMSVIAHKVNLLGRTVRLTYSEPSGLDPDRWPTYGPETFLRPTLVR